MSSIPEDIYRDILLRVPVRSTFVCKFVCKTWFYIISNPSFVQEHLSFTIKRNNYSLLHYNGSYYSTSYDSLLSSSFDTSGNAVAVKIDFPYKYSRNVIGSCIGLIYAWNHRLKSFFLWNPVTQEYKTLLVNSDSKYCSHGPELHGLGYDYKTDDYKLVNIDASYEVQVYSLKSNSWRSLQSKFKYGYFGSQRSGLLFNGALHWFGIASSETALVSMNINEERFGKLQLPMGLQWHFDMSMEVLQERLCVLAYKEDVYEVWVMQDYGVPESWTKLYTITFEYGLRVRFIGSSRNGEILLKDIKTGNVIVYDPKHGTPRKTELQVFDGVVNYHESLVTLNSTTAVGRMKREKSLGTIEKE